MRDREERWVTDTDLLKSEVLSFFEVDLTHICHDYLLTFLHAGDNLPASGKKPRQLE